MGGWNENVTVDPCLQCWRIHCSCQAPPCCRPSSRCGLTHSTGTPPRYLVWERGKSVFEGKALVFKFHCTNFKKQCTRFWIELSSRLTWIETRFWIPDSQKQIHLVLHKKKFTWFYTLHRPIHPPGPVDDQRGWGWNHCWHCWCWRWNRLNRLFRLPDDKELCVEISCHCGCVHLHQGIAGKSRHLGAKINWILGRL